MIYVATIIGIAVAVLVLMPFFLGEGGRVEESPAFKTEDGLVALQEHLLLRYLADEEACGKGSISERSWAGRKSLLVGRYIDVARRLDMLRSHKSGEEQDV